ncbi:MAG: inorganic diphosphatase [Candidatus Uhrbacteria bacterium]
MRESKSLQMARGYLGQLVEVQIDRPIGSTHPTYGYVYPINYGYVPGTKAPDGKELDVFVLGVGEPIESFSGRCIAVIHRDDDDDDRLIVVSDGVEMGDDEIMSAVEFQEQYFHSSVVRE